MRTVNVVSVSGGKDSSATAALALELGVENLVFVFADTGHEHPLTYEYLDTLEEALGRPIRRVKADFSKQIERKRTVTMEKWRKDGVPEAHIEQVKALLVPTGNPFLDLCLWKGRFPSTKARFCTEELKVIPIQDQVIFPLLKEYGRVISWQGVRRDESKARANAATFEGIEPDAQRVFAYRPIAGLTAEDVFSYLKKRGIPYNPLYEMGMGRVGCMPCVNTNKAEIKAIAKNFPEEIERVRLWEELVSNVSKRKSATLLPACTDPTVDTNNEQIHYLTHGIGRIVDWANTSRGGRQKDLIDLLEIDEPMVCSSIYGLCE